MREIAGFQVAYRGGTADEEVLRHSFDHDIFFPGIPEYQPRSDHVILDVGAHIGTFALLAASRVPDGHVHAVEACSETADLLDINVRLNALRNVSVHRLALWDTTGVGRLHYDAANWGHSLVVDMSYGGESIATDTLAGFVAAHGIAHCHLAKFNCEGAEFRILLSASPSLLSRFDTLLILYHCDLADQRLEPLVEHLHACEFRTATRHVMGERGWLIATRERRRL